MSQEEVYKNLELQIRTNMEYLKENDPFFYHCMDEVYTIIKNAPIPQKRNPDQQKGSFSSTENNITLAAEFLALCHPKYSQRFLDDYKRQKIKVLENSKSCCQENIKTKEYQVIINKTNTLKEALDMVHEYFHVLNLELSRITYIRQSFTETISLTAELLFLDFLKEKGVSQCELQLLKNHRIDFYINNALSVQYLLPIYREVKKNNHLPDDFYEKKEPYYKKKKIAKRTFLTCAYEISQDKNSITSITCYKYVIGYAYASYFHQQGGTTSRLGFANEHLKAGDIISSLNILAPENVEVDELNNSIKKEIYPQYNQKTKYKRASIQ